MQSDKQVIELKELVGERIFNLPKDMANHVDVVTGRPCIFVGVNGTKYYIPVEEPTPIPYNAFCALKDIGVEKYYKDYEEGEDIT